MVNYFICDWKIRKLLVEEVDELIDIVVECECLLFADAPRQTSAGYFLTLGLETSSEYQLKEFITRAGAKYGISEWIPKTKEDMTNLLNITWNRGVLMLAEICQRFGES